MPALSGRGPFSYDTITLSGTNIYTLVNASYDPTNGETLEVLVAGAKIQGVGLSISGTIITDDLFYVNSLTNPTTISLVTPSTDEVVIRRISNRSTPEVDFAPGSVIRETDLDASTNQTLHVAQEAIDIAISGMVLEANDKFDGKSKVVENVADGVADNDAVNKAQLVATEVATLAYKEDTEDYKLEAGDWATKVNAVVDTYTDNVAQGDGSEYSAKEYAQGSTLAAGGSSKNWAQLATTPTTTATDASAKEWATGVSTHKAEGSSKDWATYTAGDVRGATGGSMSSKEWAVGSQGRGTVNEGSAKEWATLPVSTGTVDNASYSSKEYSQSTTAGTSTYGGSAKGWASTVYGDAVPGAGASDRSALHYSTDASNSAVAAKNSAAAVASTFDAFDDTYLGTMADNATASSGTANGTWVKNSSSITLASISGTIEVGQLVTNTSGGSAIPTGANVLSYDAGTATVVLSENMALLGSAVGLTFVGYGVYGAWNGTKDGPSTDNDDGTLADGMLYFNSTDNNMMVYKETGAAWIAATSSGGVSLVMHKYVYASGTATSALAAQFSPTLTYEVNNIVVWLNGVKLDATDYVATNGNDITSLAALAVDDEVVVLAFKTFEVADAVSAASGGTFGGAVTFSAVPVFSAGVGGITGTTIDATTDFTIGGTVITDNTITDDGTLVIASTTATSFSDGNITNVGSIALDSIVADGTSITLSSDTALSAGKDLETSTTGKVQQKGAFMQSSTHQALTLGG